MLGGFGGRPLGPEQGVRSCFRSCCLVGGCLGFGRFARSLVLVAFASVASMVYCRVVVRKNGKAAEASFVCLFVMLIVVIGLFIAGLTARLCGWLIRSALHGMVDNDDGHGDDATRLRVFDFVATRLRVCGGACWAASADVRLGASSACVRVLDLAAWFAGVWVLDGLPGAS
jgi:hypothetical protein